jgi:hypothetical protein
LSAKVVNRSVIDWADLKAAVIKVAKGDALSVAKLEGNRNMLRRHISNIAGSWAGFSASQALDWITNGYQTDALADIEDFVPPIREKRRFIYADEGDEIDLSAAWSGEDNFFTQWTKREVIPGVKLEIRVGTSADVSASVISEYLRWTARAIFAIEAAGIDPEISYFHEELWRHKGRQRSQTVVRVKREGETADLQSYSAMLSPASYRCYMFAAVILAADKLGLRCDSGIGETAPGDRPWNVWVDTDSGAIVTQMPRQGFDTRAFPEAHMTMKLREAIAALKSG